MPYAEGGILLSLTGKRGIKTGGFPRVSEEAFCGFPIRNAVEAKSSKIWEKRHLEFGGGIGVSGWARNPFFLARVRCGSSDTTPTYALSAKTFRRLMSHPSIGQLQKVTGLLSAGGV